MRTYEATFIASPELTEEEVNAFITQMEGVIESKGAETTKIDRWGKRPLAFRVGKFNEGHVVILTIEGQGEAIAELERRFRVTDTILRYLTVRVDPALRRFEKLKAKRNAKQARRAAASRTPQPPGASREINTAVPKTPAG